MLKSDPYLKAAYTAALNAGDIIKSNLGRLRTEDVGRKQAADFVTTVDRKSESEILSVIKKAFPSHSIMSEEDSPDVASGGFRWIIDPLDGTTNFIHGFPFFAVSIALEEDGRIIRGLVYDPLREEVFWAARGQGAFTGEGVRLNASQPKSLDMALLSTGFPFKQKHRLDDYLEAFRRIFLEVSGIRRAGAAAIDLAYLAAGRCDGFFELGLAPWDIAAGSLLIEEAGGMITDFSGGRDYLSTGNVIAGGQVVHEFMHGVISEVFRGKIEK